MNGLKDDRKPVIAGGLAIMTAILEELDIGEMTIADGALREGVMYDMLGRRTEHDLRNITIERLKKLYKVDTTQSNNVYKTTMQLFMSLMIHNKPDSEQLKLLQWASVGAQAGKVIAFTRPSILCRPQTVRATIPGRNLVEPPGTAPGSGPLIARGFIAIVPCGTE